MRAGGGSGLAGTMQFDVGRTFLCALNLVPESTSGAHEVRPYGKQFSFAIYER